MENNRKIVLIDGNSILNRAYYGVPVLTNSKGLHTNAIYGFLNIMFKIIDEEKPEYLAVAFDVKKPTFRHEMYKEYKGTRKPMPEELKEQMPVLRSLLDDMNILTISKAGWEADDILGTLARISKENGISVALISGDRDMLQLSDNDVMIRIPKTGRGGTQIENYYPEDVYERYMLTPAQIIEVKSLMGDSSDNIPGVPGIGEKTAVALLQQFPSLDEIYNHIDEIAKPRTKKLLEENKELAYLSHELATINVHADIEFELSQAFIKDIFTQKAYESMRELDLKSLLRKFKNDNTDADKSFGKNAAVTTNAMESSDNSANQSADSQMYSNKTNDIKRTLITNKKDCDNLIKEIKSTKLSLSGIALIGDEWAGRYARQKKKKSGSAAQITFNFEEDGSFSSLDDGEENENNFDFYGISIYSENTGCICVLKDENISYEILMDIVVLVIEKSDILCVCDIKNFLHLIENKTTRKIENKEKICGAYGKFFDVKLASYLINPLADNYTIADIAQHEMNQLLPSYAEIFGKDDISKLFDERSIDEISLDKNALEFFYSLAYVPGLSYKELHDKLSDNEMLKLLTDIEMPTAYYLYCMEAIGVCADKQELGKMSQMFGEKIEALEKEIYELAGEEFNINSPKQLGVILFDKMKLPFAKKTKTGYSTSADVLEKLIDIDPIVEKILEYRQISKLKSTYADGLAPFIDTDGRIHGKFNQTITATGRISSTDPNLQNIPVRVEIGRKLRSVFKPKTGCIFLDADYSQIELRLLAHMSDDKELIEAYKGGEDIHAITASKVFNVPFNEVTSQQRRNAKAVNFGIIYGISSFGLGRDLGISGKQAKEYITQYFQTYPYIKTYLDNLVAGAKSNGYAKTMYDRRRPVPELSAANHMQRAFGERIAMNSPIQGSAADIIKLAMINVCRRIEREKLRSRVVLQVHDELLVETYMDEKEAIRKILEEEMKNVASLKVKLEVEVNEGIDWYSAH